MSKDNDTDEPSVTVTPQIFSPSFLVSENIETQLFAIAKEHADLASKDIDRNDVEKRRKEMKHSIIAIVMSYTALEALSNHLFKILTGKGFSSEQFNKFDKNKQGLAGKWEKLADLAFKTKNPNAEFILSEDFGELLKPIKDSRHKIIHYKTNPMSAEELKKIS